MIDKKRKDLEGDPQDVTPAEMKEETATQSDSKSVTTISASEFESLKKNYEEVQAQAAEYKDGWQRAVADFQNYRRRTDAEKAETYQNAIGDIIKRYLPVVDDLERALASRPADFPWVEGIDLIYRKLKTILDAEGVIRIDCVANKFDPNLHEAISYEPAEGVESGCIISVIQQGYRIGEKVIRPAQVRVAK